MAVDFREMLKSARENRYAIYCLVMMMLAYLVNQLNAFSLVATNLSMANEFGYGERECVVDNLTALNDYLTTNALNITPTLFCLQDETWCTDVNYTFCDWRYTGTGWEYQLLAGPFYVVMFSISGIPLGLVSELQNINRKWLLAACVALWSVMTILGGFATQYWHIAITRILMGVFSAGCVPFSASMIADYFTPEQRGAALGFFNWGVYVGYSITFLLLIAERNLGWRAVYFLAGAPGIVVAVVILVTVQEPSHGESDVKQEQVLSALRGTCSKLHTAGRHFAKPTLLLLCIGGAIRNGAGIVWAYNIVIFFDQYHPGTQTEEWMSWIPLIFGSLGAFGGGYVSDKLVASKGTRGRLMVLIACLLLSAPFQVGTLFLPMPWAFIIHIPAYLIGEMWIGVCVAVVVDLVPSDLTASAVAVYFFIIQIIGGNMNLLVPPLTQHLSLQLALVVTFPGLYLAGALFFIAALLVVSYSEGDSQYMVTNIDTETKQDSLEASNL